jgi:hypothetical protein
MGDTRCFDCVPDGAHGWVGARYGLRVVKPMDLSLAQGLEHAEQLAHDRVCGLHPRTGAQRHTPPAVQLGSWLIDLSPALPSVLATV